MAQVKRFKARLPFKLDCGHEVRTGDGFVVVKVFTCEADSKKIPFAKTEPVPSKK